MKILIFLKWQCYFIVGTNIISFCLAFDYLYKWFPKEVIVLMIQIFGLLNVFFSKKIKKEIKEYERKEKKMKVLVSYEPEANYEKND